MREKRDVRGRILQNVRVGAGVFRLRLFLPRLAGSFLPGQFLQLRLRPGDVAPFLRRPFAPSDYEPEGLSLIYAVAGRGTRLLSELPPGAEVDVLAPLGNSFSLLPAGSAAVLAGGGVGFAGLLPLARRLSSDGVEVTGALGTGTAAALPPESAFPDFPGRLLIATDDGSRGFHGNVVDALGAEGIAGTAARLYACGPLPMLAAAARLAAAEGVGCEVSLEARLACGFGACLGCAVPVLDGKGYRRVCRDGPVFAADALDWPALLAGG
ncbi:MAG: dihydroorotate dehydrogenase electron transfer subunit [Planctomycetota bacterium]|jgi:dihydroorotate dehydrogenase electron transfer subunit|nr:dihydroorotate dehydrogenase electron transfer subunit [Planctomycetota bacterium]